MKLGSVRTRGPEPPHFIDGRRYYNARQAASLVGVSEPTMRNWFRQGATPFGFVLELRRTPVVHAPRGRHRDTQVHREWRALISEVTVLALKATLSELAMRNGQLRPPRAAMLATAERYQRFLKLSGHNP